MRCMACGEAMSVPWVVRKSALFPGVRYVRCRECMTVQVAEAPPADQIAAFYDRFYINDAQQTLLARLLGWLRGVSERARARSLVAHAMRQSGGFVPSGSLVDFGSGNGMLTRALRAAGGPRAHVVSIDAAQDVLSLHGVANETWHVSESELLQRLGETTLRFGAVFFSHTLEHFVDPLGVLRAVTRRLADDGRIHVDCPSGLHPIYTHASDLNIPDFMFVTPKGVRALAQLAGCELLDLQGISPGPSFLYRPPETAFLQYVATFMFLARSVITGDGYFAGRRPLWWRVTLRKASSPVN
jgi:SAM-dependent methyltransferase